MEPVKTGTRLSCATCGTQIIVVKAPSALPRCCGASLLSGVEQNEQKERDDDVERSR